MGLTHYEIRHSGYNGVTLQRQLAIAESELEVLEARCEELLNEQQNIQIIAKRRLNIWPIDVPAELFCQRPSRFRHHRLNNL